MKVKRFKVKLYDRVYYPEIGEFYDEVNYIITAISKSDALGQALEWWTERSPNYTLDNDVDELTLDKVIDEWWFSRIPKYEIKKLTGDFDI